MESLPVLPGPVLRVIEAIQRAGGQGYVVGGALRDLMLHHNPEDWDIAATLTPRQLMALFPAARPIGGNCGTLSLDFESGSCEITPCRTEGDYTDHRHPDKVDFFPNILLDLTRRDFTVNAMAYDGQVLFDPFGGQRDLAAKLLRCVGDPCERFAEDPLRILRMYRFSATLGFSAEWHTYCAAGDLTDRVATLSRERVRDELQAILTSENPQVLSPFIVKGGLYRYGFTFSPSLSAMKEVPAEPLCRWWALMALCGADPERVAKEFGFSRKDLLTLNEYTRLYRLGPAKNRLELKEKLRNLRVDYAPVAATFAAVSPTYAGEPVLFAAVLINKEPYRVADLAINGDMLRYEGIKGRRCGRILDELLGAVIKNPALNKTPVLLGLARGLRHVI